MSRFVSIKSQDFSKYLHLYMNICRQYYLYIYYILYIIKLQYFEDI